MKSPISIDATSDRRVCADITCGNINTNVAVWEYEICKEIEFLMETE